MADNTSNRAADVTPDHQGALWDQTVLITGAARRVGAQLARTLHAAGAQVVVHYHHSKHEAEALVQALEQARPGSALALAADLLDVNALPLLLDATIRRFGALNLLINNASSFYPTPMGQITAAQWDDLMGSNLRAPLFLSQAAAPHLRATRGSVLNIADIHGMRPLRDHSVYCAAKAGLIMLTRALARELAPLVRVNAIAPGPVLWPEGELPADRQQKILDHTPLQHIGSPEDIARAAVFFATQAPFVTGQILAVDGGRSIGW